MSQILVRNLDKEVVQNLKRNALENGRSLEAEVRMILEREALTPKVDPETAVRMALRLQKKFKNRKLPDSVKLIREDRDR